MPHAIEVQHLVKSYSSGRSAPVRAVNDLTFSVARGSIFGLLGPNGAGKTTTLKVLTTLTRLTSGTVRVEGFDVQAEPLEVRRRIAVVIQESAADLFLTVRDNFDTFGRFHGLRPAAIRARMADLLDQFGLAADANRKVDGLERRVRRRVQVAKIFMVDTPVVFLDEFSTGMDPAAQARVMDETARRKRREAGPSC